MKRVIKTDSSSKTIPLILCISKISFMKKYKCGSVHRKLCKTLQPSKEDNLRLFKDYNY